MAKDYANPRPPVEGSLQCNRSHIRDAVCALRSGENRPRRRSMKDFVKIEKGLGPEGRIAVVRFDRHDGINALSPEALRQLTAAARSFEDDAATSVVVLTIMSGAVS